MIRTPQKIRMIKTEDIIPNPYQTRRKFSEKELKWLCDSIKEVGLLSPVIVRGCMSGYELICGQRRVRACIMAGIKSVPAIVIRAGDLQCAQLSMIENLQRKNLSVYEEAEGYFNLMAYHRVKKEKLLKILSAESLKINEKMRFLEFSEKVRHQLEEKEIPENISVNLLKLHDEEKQIEIIEKMDKEDISYKSLNDEVKNALREMAQKNREAKIKRDVNISLYINTVKKTVELLKNSGAKVEMSQSENEKYVEFTIKTFK